VWPDGNDGDDSKGGTASDLAGLVRSIDCLPMTVNASDPPAAIAIKSRGVSRRHQAPSSSAAETATHGITAVLPRSVNDVTVSSRPLERHRII